VYYSLLFYLWGVPRVDFLKTIPYKESSQIGKRRFVVELLCVWCGVVWCGGVSYPRAAVFLLCNTPILYFNYAIYIDFKNNCSAIVNGAAPEDGNVQPKHVA
jgi:hypothetical protein